MSSLEKSNTIREVRERKQWQQHMLLQTSTADSTVSRVENSHNDPMFVTFSDFMETMEIPVDAYFCSYLDNVSLDVYTLRDQTLYYLEWAKEYPPALEKAKELLDKILTMGDFSEGINRQMVLSIQARIYELEGKDPAGIISLAQEGILLTYPEYDQHKFDDNILLFEEPTLKHSAARALAKSDPDAAIEQMQKIRAGLERLHGDDKEKEKRLAPVLLELSQLLIETGDYA